MTSEQRTTTMDENPTVLLDEEAKARLGRFVRNLNPASPMAPHPLDKGRWRDFVEYVFQRAKPKHARALVATAGPVRTLLSAYGLDDEATAFWAHQYASYMRGWANWSD